MNFVKKELFFFSFESHFLENEKKPKNETFDHIPNETLRFLLAFSLTFLYLHRTPHRTRRVLKNVQFP